MPAKIIHSRPIGLNTAAAKPRENGQLLQMTTFGPEMPSIFTSNEPPPWESSHMHGAWDDWRALDLQQALGEDADGNP